LSDSQQTKPKTADAITDEDIERAQRQIGVPKFSYNKPYNQVASPDRTRHFAFACGDGNPLYNDREYGATTRWGDNTAPGTATVMLPSRDNGPVVLPEAEPEAIQRAAGIQRVPAEQNQL
jgi:hypothetical protein